MRIEVRRKPGADWPDRGHHLRVMTFPGPGTDRCDLQEVAVDVGSNEIETGSGHHVLRLFHTEGTWEEKQIPAGKTAEAEFTPPDPEYAFGRPDRIATVGPIDAETAWSLFTSHPTDAAPILTDGFAVPTGPGIHMAAAMDGAAVTAFMIPWTRPDAVLDVRVYAGSPRHRTERRTRIRWNHPELGMAIPHLAMSQFGSASPHVDRLIADGAFGRLLADGDACGALAIALVQTARRHEVGDPTPMLEELAEAFPLLPDAHMLLAYERIAKGRRDEAVALAMRSIACGPPVMTGTIQTMNGVVMHLDHVPAIVEAGRIAWVVDPGCLFTSRRLTVEAGS